LAQSHLRLTTRDIFNGTSAVIVRV
jgi:hypothetical protein